jgi:hypothetical protein
MSALRERGDGKLGAILWLAFFVLIVYAIWNVAPVYIQHYALVDKTNELARAPKWNHPDDRIYDLLMKYVREERLDAYVQRNSFSISTLETSRRITLGYNREAQILPGWKHTFKFTNQVDQPLVY